MYTPIFFESEIEMFNFLEMKENFLDSRISDEWKEQLKQAKSFDDLAVTPSEILYKYAFYVKQGRFLEGESVIAQSGLQSLKYAVNVVRDRFPLGEPAIAQIAKYSVQYAVVAINKRFELGEYVIADSAKQSYIYSRDVINKRFLPGEAVVFKNPYFCEKYKTLWSL
jgi:hypothetical protein